MARNPRANAGGTRCGFDPCIRKILWSRKWQPTPGFLPEKFHRQKSLAGYSPRGHRVRLDGAYTLLYLKCIKKKKTYT